MATDDATTNDPNDPLELHPTLRRDSGQNSEAGLAPLLLTVVELLRQLMEAQVIRRMEAEQLTDAQLDEAADSIRKLEEQVLRLCEIFEIDPADLNIDLGEFGTLLPKTGGYYPGEKTNNPTILEMLDRLLNTGVVVQGDVDLGLANLNLVHAKLRLVLTSQPIAPYRSRPAGSPALPAADIDLDDPAADPMADATTAAEIDSESPPNDPTHPPA